MDGLRGNSEVT